MPHTVEEAYEVADAALANDDAKLEDELGDLLFQTYFLALLLQERGAGSLESVARSIEEKLVRRHPHVFGDVDAETPGRVRANWEQIKAQLLETKKSDKMTKWVDGVKKELGDETTYQVGFAPPADATTSTATK